MTSPVQLYVYDLSNGLAARLSLQLTGRQINGIWHTSVVVFGKEVFYGQGISITKPGQSHHGAPLQVLDMGMTAIDEETFNDYIEELRNVYTADKYHLLDFNCNSFTDDVVGFLTGSSIPSWIKDLPSDFLSTPFGAALRPTIDNMFRRPAPGYVNQGQTAPRDSLATSLLQNAAARATGPAPRPTLPATDTLTAPVLICTNMQHFRTITKEHRAVTVLFTSQTCPPCRMIEPVFEELAERKATKGVAFVKIDMGNYSSAEIARTYSIHATPTFLFFLDGSKKHELKGANAGELKTQVDLLIYEAYPPHPHTKKSYPAIRDISIKPILFSQLPNMTSVQAKLLSFIEANSSLTFSMKTSAKDGLIRPIISFIESQIGEKQSERMDYSNAVFQDWVDITAKLFAALPDPDLFPLIDIWRLAILDKSLSIWCASRFSATGVALNPVTLVLERVHDCSGAPKSLLLTSIRLLANVFGEVTLVHCILSREKGSSNGIPSRLMMKNILVSSMLHPDPNVRTAAASLAFNIAAYYHAPRIESQRSERRGETPSEDLADGEWEIEVVSAIVEALRTERSSDDVLHRLLASLALFVYLSPFYESEIKPLLDVLQARDILFAKLAGGEGGFGEHGVKKELQPLLHAVADLIAT